MHAEHGISPHFLGDVLCVVVAHLCSIWLCPWPSNSDHSQPMLPAGVLILCLELQAQYLPGLQDSAMAGCNLKEHAQGGGLGHGA